MNTFLISDVTFVTKNGIQVANDSDLKRGGVLGHDFSSRMLNDRIQAVRLNVRSFLKADVVDLGVSVNGSFPAIC